MQGNGFKMPLGLCPALSVLISSFHKIFKSHPYMKLKLLLKVISTLPSVSSVIQCCFLMLRSDKCCGQYNLHLSVKVKLGEQSWCHFPSPTWTGRPCAYWMTVSFYKDIISLVHSGDGMGQIVWLLSFIFLHTGSSFS